MDYFKALIDKVIQQPFLFKMTCICIIPLCLFAIFCFFIGNKQISDLDRLKYEGIRLTKTIDDIQADLFNPKLYHKQMNNLKTLQKNLQIQLDVDFTFLSLLHTLSAIGSDLGLVYLDIDPGEKQIFESYSTFTINISLVGHFQQLIHYISNLFSLNFLITVARCQMSPIVAEQDYPYHYIDKNLPIELVMMVVVYRFD